VLLGSLGGLGGVLGVAPRIGEWAILASF
jgi:hypothetical protein